MNSPQNGWLSFAFDEGLDLSPKGIPGKEEGKQMREQDMWGTQTEKSRRSGWGYC